MAMKRYVFFLIAVLAVSAVTVPLAYFLGFAGKASPEKEVYFGVTYGQNTFEEAKLLIDRVKNYTNLFVINSAPISENQTALNEIADYAAKADLHFIVYFFSLYNATWKQQWVDEAQQTWGEKFLGVYLRDEPGGRQIELKEPVANASTYSEAAEKFVQSMSSSFSIDFLNTKGVPIFTSDFTLYWFDYLGGYSTVFAELGWNNSRPQEIGLCRGAANALGRDWGAIITWTYQHPPYMAEGPQIYQDMVDAYEAGAKYIAVFDYPKYPDGNPYGVLLDEHFAAMEQFWDYAAAHPREPGSGRAEAAFVLPKDYGWGMRSLTDNIWGLWEPDASSPIIWQNMNTLIDRYGLQLDIVYDDGVVDLAQTSAKVYLSNQTIS